MSELARRYAKALFALHRDEPRLRKDAALLTQPALWTALRSPCIPLAQKNAVLERLLGQESPLFLNFYKLLCARGRISLLEEIVAAYHDQALARENAADAVLRCAVPPAPAQEKALAAALCQKHGKSRVELRVREDPSLLGGFVLEIEGKSYDRSVAGMLRDMGSRLAKQ